MNYQTHIAVKKAARFNGWVLVVVAGMVLIGIAAKAASDGPPMRHFVPEQVETAR